MNHQELLIRRASADDRLPVFRMLELYQHDLSDIWDQDLDAHGEYGYALDHYWSKSAFRAFVALVSGRYAGFALVNDSVRVGPGGSWVEQFFVLKKYRRLGIGSELANSLFDQAPGLWEVGQMSKNESAKAFWRRVISNRTSSNYVEQVLEGGTWEGLVQRFEIPAPTK